MKFKELKKIIEKLKSDERKKIVEGKRDKKALKKLGISNVETLKNKPLREVTTEINKEVVLLTDFDRTGKKTASRIIRLLKAKGINTDLNHKKKLGKLKGISEIEEIPSKYQELKKER